MHWHWCSSVFAHAGAVGGMNAWGRMVCTSMLVGGGIGVVDDGGMCSHLTILGGTFQPRTSLVTVKLV